MKVNGLSAFTLPEILVAVSIFSVVATIVSGLYIQAFRESKDSNFKNQIYEDARFIMDRIADEIRSGTVDYDEYYNQYVVSQLGAEPANSAPFGAKNYGQNYGRYYSAFFYPGSDQALGFDCSDGGRNERSCILNRRTLDKNTGENSFPGKVPVSNMLDSSENAFCGTVRYLLNESLSNEGKSPDGLTQFCDNDKSVSAGIQVHKELYLISADGRQKTILAREVIGYTGDQAANSPVYALSLLRLKDVDTNNDDIPDTFICADGFQCRGTDDVARVGSPSVSDAGCYGSNPAGPAELPRPRNKELNPSFTEFPADNCDNADNFFSKDFVPISPLRVKVDRLDFYITPSENPHYAFAEEAEQKQPAVTVVLTISQNTLNTGTDQKFEPVTLVETVSSRVLDPIPAPLLVN